MDRTILIGSPQSTWKEWVFKHREGADVLVADPADSYFGHPGRIVLVRGDRVVGKRFVGALNAARNPVRIVAAIAELLTESEGATLVQLFPYRPHPANLELLRSIVSLVNPARIFKDDRVSLETGGWPIEPEVVELESAPPSTLQTALRKAQWLKFRQTCVRHTIDIARIDYLGARIGSGKAMSAIQRQEAGLDSALRVEVEGSTLFIVADEPIDDVSIARAFDLTHTHRAHFAKSSQYENLICSLRDSSGKEIAMGFIEQINFESGEMAIASPAVPPSPVASVALGLLYVDGKGNETGEAKLWEI